MALLPMYVLTFSKNSASSAENVGRAKSSVKVVVVALLLDRTSEVCKSVLWWCFVRFYMINNVSLNEFFKKKLSICFRVTLEILRVGILPDRFFLCFGSGKNCLNSSNNSFELLNNTCTSA